MDGVERRVFAQIVGDDLETDPVQERLFSSPCEKRKISSNAMKFRLEIEQEEDGRWIAEVIDLPGVLAYGNTPDEAKAKVQALALRVVADRLEHGEAGPDLVTISFAAA